MELTISVESTVPAADVAAVLEGLNAHNDAHTGLGEMQPLHLMLREPGGALRGGLSGWTWGDALHVSVLWVSEALRGQGHGSQLLARAEAEGRARGARQSQLSTWEFQGLEFYRGRGYRVFGELADYPHGHRRYFLAKALDGASVARP